MSFRTQRKSSQPVHSGMDGATSSAEWTRQLVSIRNAVDSIREPDIDVDGRRVPGSVRGKTMVEVTFAGANTDLRVDHDLDAVDVHYYPVKMDRATTIYDGDKVGGRGYVYLKSSVANAKVRLMVFGREG